MPGAVESVTTAAPRRDDRLEDEADAVEHVSDMVLAREVRRG